MNGRVFFLAVAAVAGAALSCGAGERMVGEGRRGVFSPDGSQIAFEATKILLDLAREVNADGILMECVDYNNYTDEMCEALKADSGR